MKSDNFMTPLLADPREAWEDLACPITCNSIERYRCAGSTRPGASHALQFDGAGVRASRGLRASHALQFDGAGVRAPRGLGPRTPSSLMVPACGLCEAWGLARPPV